MESSGSIQADCELSVEEEEDCCEDMMDRYLMLPASGREVDIEGGRKAIEGSIPYLYPVSSLWSIDDCWCDCDDDDLVLWFDQEDDD